MPKVDVNKKSKSDKVTKMSKAEKAPKDKSGKTAKSDKKSEPKETVARKDRVANPNFATYITKVLKQVNPWSGFTLAARNTVNRLANHVIEYTAVGINMLMAKSTIKTVSLREVRTAIQLRWPGDLSQHAIIAGDKAVAAYRLSIAEKPKKGEKKTISRSTRAGLQFPVTRTEELLLKHVSSKQKRKTATAGVFMAAALEYIVAEVLELSGNAARDYKKIRIKDRHIRLAIGNDSELNKLFSGAIFAGGQMPNILAALVPKTTSSEDKPKKKAAAKKAPVTTKAAKSKKAGRGSGKTKK